MSSQVHQDMFGLNDRSETVNLEFKLNNRDEKALKAMSSSNFQVVSLQVPPVYLPSKGYQKEVESYHENDDLDQQHQSNCQLQRLSIISVSSVSSSSTNSSGINDDDSPETLNLGEIIVQTTTVTAPTAADYNEISNSPSHVDGAPLHSVSKRQKAAYEILESEQRYYNYLMVIKTVGFGRETNHLSSLCYLVLLTTCRSCSNLC
jgi:hypothetical protein